MIKKNDNKIIYRLTNLLSNERYYGILSALLAMGILLLALSYGQMLGGKYTYISGDLYGQCAPFAQLLVNKLITGKYFYYSFNAGLGMNTSLLFAFYSLSPLNLLYIFSDGSNVNGISIVVLTLKVGIAAYAFQLYSRFNLRVGNFISVLFAVGYSLVSYGIASSYMIPLYDGIYLLPFILYSIKYMFEYKKSVWLILLYAILFVSNFYSGYIVGIVSFVYFIILFLSKNRTGRGIYYFVHYFWAFICSVLLSAFILAPALYEALAQNVIESNYSFEAVPLWDAISYLFPFHNRVLFKMTPYYYCGMPAVLLSGAFFTNSHICMKNKIVGAMALVLTIVSMVYQPAYIVAHMFNDPTGYTFRYVYIISFAICSMGVITLREKSGINIKQLIIIDSIIVLLHIMAPFINRWTGHFDNSPSIVYYIITIGLVIVWIYLLIKYTKCEEIIVEERELMKRKIAVVAVVVLSFELCLNSYILLIGHPYQVQEDVANKMRQADGLIKEVKAVDSSFYRINYNGLANPNQACLYDYYGCSLFASSNNHKLKDFLYSIGLSCTDFDIMNNGNSDLAKILLYEKYDLENDLYDSGSSAKIKENIVCSVGYMLKDDATNFVIGDDVFENQNLVYSVLYGAEIKPYSNYDGEISIENDNMLVVMTDEGEIVFGLQDDAERGYLCMNIPCVAEYDMYSWLSTGSNTIDPLSPIIYSPLDSNNNVYVSQVLSAPHIVKMTKEDGEYVVAIWMVSGTAREALLRDYKFALYDDAYINLLQEKLSKQSFNVETFEDGYVTGNITATEPGICFMSIPYEAGWSAVVDGEPQEITPVLNETFIGIPLDAGYHEIELRFEAPLSRLGCTLSIVGVIMLVTIGVTEHIGNKKRSKM